MKINHWKLCEMTAREKDLIVKRSETDIQSVTAAVASIIDDVKNRGDEALRFYGKKFDGVIIDGDLQASEADFEKAYRDLDPAVTKAIRQCAANVRTHHEQQLRRVEWQWIEEIKPGVFAGEKITPIPSVGLYVPRGKGAFPSVMYMLCTPAVIAGVKRIAVCTPPSPTGDIDAASLVAADICGVKTVYKSGGAQAIAAFAYGTETIPKVSQISGPGNPYVAAAKRLLAHMVNPGMPAGPSEAIILADQTADPWNTVLDLINEAEHGPDSASLLVTTSQELADNVIGLLPKAVSTLPQQRKEYCEAVFAQYGGVIVCESLGEAVDFCNEYAAEHLLLKVEQVDEVLAALDNCGEMLIGESTPIVLANFGIGTNAVLPTGRHALTHDCTSVWTFLKRTSLAYVTRAGYGDLKESVATLADYEGFAGHREVLKQRNEKAFSDINLMTTF